MSPRAMGEFLVRVADAFGLEQPHLVGPDVRTGMERYTPSGTARDDYLTSYAGERFAESMTYARTYPTSLAELRDLLPTIQTPVEIINGKRDPVVPPENAEYLHERRPAFCARITHGPIARSHTSERNHRATSLRHAPCP